jgi:putative hemolysin
MAPILFLAIVLLVSSCIPPTAVAPASVSPTPAAALPNPASAFCEQHGFRLEIRTAADGSQSGICHFPDGSECDEWAFYRGECAPTKQTEGSTSVAPTAPVASATAVGPRATEPETMPTSAVTYISAALGIDFSYLPEQNGQSIGVLEQGDRIYVYPANMEPTAGQWVQVFEKPADESLVDAITRVIMPGYPADDCQVKQIERPLGGRAAGQTGNYEYAGIAVRRAPGEDDAAVLPRWKTCPQPYTVVGGIGYFQADPQHPTKFLFFSIGQYGIMAGDGLPWQETIRFE